MRGEAKIWLDFAYEDLRMAELALKEKIRGNMITLYTPATGFPDLEVKIACGLIRTRIKVDDKFKKSKDCMLLFTKKSLCSKKVRIWNV